MSDVFKIINATKEEACRTAEAEAIRAKTGETESLSYDFANGKGFADAIAAISGGGSDDTIEIRGVTGAYVNADYDAEKVVVHIDPDGAAGNFVAGINTETGAKVKEVTFIADGVSPFGNATSRFYRYGKNALSVVEKIEFVNIPFMSIYQAFQCVYSGKTSLKSILGLDMRYSATGNYTYGSAFINLTALENVTFVPNTFGRNAIGETGNTIDFSVTSRLTDESLVSIANGLCSANTKEIKFHNTQKARLPLILGTVSQKTDDFSTYDFFTADASGTVTLENFITQIKGWTVA